MSATIYTALFFVIRYFYMKWYYYEVRTLTKKAVDYHNSKYPLSKNRDDLRYIIDKNKINLN